MSEPSQYKAQLIIVTPNRHFHLSLRNSRKRRCYYDQDCNDFSRSSHDFHLCIATFDPCTGESPLTRPDNGLDAVQFCSSATIYDRVDI